MPRKLRLEYRGAIYHVMNRGDRREPIGNVDPCIESVVATEEMRVRVIVSVNS